MGVLRLRHSIVAGFAAFVALTASTAVDAAPAAAPAIAPRAASRSTGLVVPASADQLIVVSSRTDAPSPPGYLATLRTYERANGESPWRPVFGAWRAETGSGHLLAAAARREGDHATPIGVFGIGRTMYGNDPNPGGLHDAYHRLVCGDWWDEDPYSPQYNHFVHVPCGVTPTFAAWSEPLWTETVAYPYFAVIQFNMNPVRAGAKALGSGIFLHGWVGGATEGCVALPEGQLLDLLRWLKPSAHPVIEIGTNAEVDPAPNGTAVAAASGSTSASGSRSASKSASMRYIDVSVATVWASPSAPRAIDRPALGNPVDMVLGLGVTSSAPRRGGDWSAGSRRRRCSGNRCGYSRSAARGPGLPSSISPRRSTGWDIRAGSRPGSSPRFRASAGLCRDRSSRSPQAGRCCAVGAARSS